MKQSGMLAAMVLLAGCATGGGKHGEDGWVEAVLLERPETFGRFTASPSTCRLQILVSEVVEDHAGARLVRHAYRLGEEYYYPASTIKLCAAVAALQWLNDQRVVGLHLSAPMTIHPLFADEELESRDETNLAGGTITIGHEIRKLFLVSDNRAFNRLYELLGHREINERMWAAGLETTRCVHRLSEYRTFADNRRTPRIEFDLGRGRRHVVPGRTSDLDIDSSHLPGLLVGRAHVPPGGGQKVLEPFDFAQKNSISLLDLQNALVMCTRPDLDVGCNGFGLSQEQLGFLRRAMSEQPSASANPVYDSRAYPDDSMKFLAPGLARVVPRDRLRVLNKVGRAYGFSTENAYVMDTVTGRSFFVTAVLYTNPNQTLNDNDYAYEQLADPFFADLGESLARKLLLRQSAGQGEP